MLRPLKAIRAKCLDCCCGSAHEVRLCPCEDCSLYPYRFGKNPNLQGARTPAQLEALKKGRILFQNVDELHDSEHNAPVEGNYTPDPMEEENPEPAPQKGA